MEIDDKYKIGEIYGVRKLLRLYRNDKNKLMAEVECINCHKITNMPACYLYNNKRINCMCKYKHYSQELLYKVLKEMIRRCNNPNHIDYGNKGIKVCDEWMGEDGYLKFKEWALANGYKKGLTIDRINNDGNYEPNNCRWITLTENIIKSNKERTHNHCGTCYGIDPDGNIYYFTNAALFAREHDLNPSHIRQIIRGYRKIHKGWTFGSVNERDELKNAI